MKKIVTKWSLIGGAIIGIVGCLGTILINEKTYWSGYDNGVTDLEKAISHYDPEWYDGFKENVTYIKGE